MTEPPATQPTIEKTADGYRLTAVQWLPLPPEQVFPFFADAHNLEKLTPGFLRFRVTTPSPIEMGVGTLIDYKLRIRGIPIRWRTEITEWEPPHYFADSQLRGPYRRWHHRHEFEAERDGTRCTDTVGYQLYGGPVAPLLNALMVKWDVLRIFAYRGKVLQKLTQHGEL